MKAVILSICWMLLIKVNGRGLSVDNSLNNGFISLYKDTEVVELFDSNISQLYNSDTLWVVQFYSHWCGHCQRFAPFWKDLAKSSSAWSPIVKFAAMNCADQSCDKYQIQGTPTIRIFHQKTIPNRLDSAFYGFNLPVKNDKEYFLDTILYNLDVVTAKGVDLPVNLKFIRNVPNPTKEHLSEFVETFPDTVEHAALIFETEGKVSVGKKVILDMNKHSDVLPVSRANFYDPTARKWKLLSSPYIVIIDRTGNIVERVNGWGVDDRHRFTNILTKYEGENLGEPKSLETQVTTEAATMYTVPDKVYQVAKDEVFMGDLEKAVEFSIMTEVAMQPILGSKKLQTLVYYIETLLNYFPNMKTPLRNFLISLREWPVQMRFASISHAEYKEKVTELSEFYSPFAATPSEWEGCAGSQSHYRGYPCSLWTLFHTLIVGATDNDPAFPSGGVSTVANAMVGYISKFFTCRECADNFSRHVAQLGYLPHTGDQSILWLWTIHNKANLMLEGDQTEDPTSPKIQWPSAQNCPDCRTDGNRWTPILTINDEAWNQVEVLRYIKSLYKAENLKQTPQIVRTNDAIEEVLNNLKKELKAENSLIFDEAHDKILNFCKK